MISEYLAEPIFAGFKVRKSDCSLVCKTASGFREVMFDRYPGYDLDRKALALEVTANYSIRYNVFLKWFEKYSVKDLKVQRQIPSLGFDNGMLGGERTFCFLEDGRGFKSDAAKYRREVLKNATYVFTNFGTLNDMYRNYIIPHIADNCKFFFHNVEWGLEMMVITRLIAPEDYEKNKQVIMNRFEEINALKDPNIEFYYDRLPEIIADMEQMEFKV